MGEGARGASTTWLQPSFRTVGLAVSADANGYGRRLAEINVENRCMAMIPVDGSRPVAGAGNIASATRLPDYLEPAASSARAF